MSKKIFALIMTVLMMATVACVSATTAFAKTALKITQQPVSVKVLSGQQAKVTVKAKGDGLTYKWYYKNKGASKYTLSKNVKTSTYTVKMKDSANGRKVYCVVTDKYGDKVKSKAVTLSKGTAVKLTQKPASVTEDCGETAKVKLTAKGDGLTYKWYYKNKGASKYTLSKNVKTSTYSVKMSSKSDGRSLYCVITDAYGNKIKTDSVKLTLEHVYTTKVTKKATCISTGTKRYTCKSCGIVKTKTLAKTDHSLSGWETYLKPTVTSTGIERNKCKNCGYYKDRTTDKLKAVTYITVNNANGKTEEIGVAADGRYSIKTPERVGYNFLGYKDSSGNAFAQSGVYKSNITVTAQWELDGTNTLAELVERTDAGVSEIKITDNITVNKPVFISCETKLYSDGDYTIRRDPSYKGDIFVVGRNRKGTMSVVLQKKAVLNIGGGNGTLTIDGNRDNLKVNVVGSAFFVADSSEMNIYDGVKIINNKKTGNERALTYKEDVMGGIVERAGGAAVLVLNSTVNIYGGEISNNAVATEYTVVENEDGTTSKLEYNACGGAIFNVGNINMYGGTISDNEALRGGGIYSDRVMYLFSGTVSGNTATTYGGGVSSSSSASADTFIGSADGEETMIFDGNYAQIGGAVYSNTSSPVIVLGNASFTNNSSATGGGAIYTAGPLTVRNSVFKDNSAIGSGGAIYHHYTKASFERRLFELADCVLEDNSASLGGAVALSTTGTASSETELGTYATITGCSFNNNKGIKTESNVGNGGAIYVTRRSEAVVSDCSFTGNTALGNGGAISVQSNSSAKLTDCSFEANQGATGGAAYAASEATLTMKNVQFTENKALKTESGGQGNGGALYLNDANVSFSNTDFENNSAENHAGAVYVCAIEINLDSTCSFKGNSAGAHGGSFYLTYKTVDSVKYGAVLNAKGVSFEGNSAMAGGAVSARTSCSVSLDNVTLKNNSAEGHDGKADGDADGGGAIYVGYGTLSLTDVTATGNTASDFGGVIDALKSEVTIKGGTFTANKSNTGGVIYALGGSEVTFSGAALNENESAYVQSGTYNSAIGGGAVAVKSSKLDISECSFDKNKAGYYGGAVHANKSEVKIYDNTTFTAAEGGTGGALYLLGSEVTLENITLTDNISTANGVIYTSGKLAAENVIATGNKASSGGVIFASGSSCITEIKNTSFSSNTAKSGGAVYSKSATVNAENCLFSENSASLGGAMYFEKGTLNTEGTLFDKNTATANGGAIDLVAATGNISADTVFNKNSAVSHGGAIYLNYTKKVEATETTPEIPAVYSQLTVDGCKLEGNTAMAGGAVSIRTGSEATFNGTDFKANISEGHDGKADGDADGGGAIYVGYGTVNLNNVTATDNETKESIYVNDEGKEKLYGFGGFIDGYHATVNFVGGTVSGNKAPSGGAVNICGENNVLTIDGTAFTANESFYKNSDYDNSKGGGAINISKAEVTVSNASFDGNSSDWYGGTVLASGSEVTIEKSVFTNSTGATGAALNFKSSCTVNITDTEIKNNISSYNGVLYANGGTVTMDNITATGNSAVNGGLIYTSGKSTVFNINNCSLTGNKATNGGIAFAENATLKFTACTISENTATSGGAVYIKKSSGKAELNSCEVNKNSAKFGGVLYSDTGAGITLDNTSFTENTATSNGGAVYVNEAAEFTVNASEFSKNYSKSNGGAIYVYRTPVALTDSSFTENSTNAHGGAINNIGSVITATGNNTFTSNTAVNHGGAIYVTYISAKAATETEEAIEAAVGVINFTGGTFTGNTAKGGGAFSVRTGCQANLTDTVLTGNMVEGYSDKNDGDGEGGGAIYVGFGDVSLTNVTATGNEAKATLYVNADNEEKYYGFGGFIDGYRADVTLIGGTVSGNKAPSGGAINMAGSANTLTINGTSFTNNESTYENLNGENDNSKGGGAIFVSGCVTELTDADFGSNKTGFYGGAVLANESELTVKGNSSFTNNTGATGSAVCLAKSCTAVIEDTAVADNTSSANGVIYTNGGTLDMTNITATGNSSANGGVLYTSGSKTEVEIKNSSFSGNSASIGGVMYINSAKVAVTSSDFKENSAKLGGVAYNTLGELTLSDCEFISNTASSNGGAISISGATVTADGTNTFSSNSATGHGGAVYVSYYTKTDNTKTAGILNAGADTFENNSALAGGAVSIRTDCIANLTGAVLKSNSSEGYSGETDGDGEGGGAIYVGYGELNLTNVTAIGNSSTSFGGVVNSLISAVTVTGSNFENNNATSEGGAIYVKGTSELNLTDTAFKANTATGKGGAISTSGSASNMVINATGCTFEANTSAQQGGAVEIQNSGCNSATDPEKVNIVFTDCTFTDNESAKTGGAVDIRSGSYAKFDGITATGNKAKQNGGVIYVTSNNSRLYLTGAVSVSDNTGNAGKDNTFIYLYHDGKYTNPPKLYTTCGSDAAWYTEELVKGSNGNRTNVAFNMATLP